MVNVEKCFEIDFSIPKNINTFAPKLGPWFKEMALFKFFIFEIQVPGSQTYTAGDLISHSKNTEPQSIGCAPLLVYCI